MNETLPGLSVTVWIAIFTGLLVLVGVIQACIYREMLRANKVIERAYLALSHHPPGLDINSSVLEGPVAKQRIGVYLGVKNLGNTPANVTSVLIQFCASKDPLPPKPPYSASLIREMRVAVVKTDDFTVFQSLDMEVGEIEGIRNGILKLYVFGYADYIDKFNCRHRCGYARVYDPSVDNFADYLEKGGLNKEAWANRNNLRFVTEPNYNYDHERKKSEGKDWNEPQ